MTYDTIVYQTETQTIAADSEGNVLSSGLISAHTDNLQIQAAINAGNVIQINPGEYTVAKNINLKSNLAISGTGATITGGTGIRIFSGGNLTDVEITGFTLIGDGTSSSYGISIFPNNNNARINIDSVTATYFNVGIRITSADNCIVSNCTVSNTLLEAIYFQWGGGTYKKGSDNLIDGCLCHTTGRYIISIEENTKSVIRDCECYGGTMGGIHHESAAGTTENIVTGCTIHDTNGVGIYFDGCTNATISDCTVTNATTHGIIARGSGCTVSACTVSGCTTPIIVGDGNVLNNTIVGKGTSASCTGIEGGNLIEGNTLTAIGGPSSTTKGAFVFSSRQTNPIIKENNLISCYTIFANETAFTGRATVKFNQIGTFTNRYWNGQPTNIDYYSNTGDAAFTMGNVPSGSVASIRTYPNPGVYRSAFRCGTCQKSAHRYRRISR